MTLLELRRKMLDHAERLRLDGGWNVSTDVAIDDYGWRDRPCARWSVSIWHEELGHFTSSSTANDTAESVLAHWERNELPKLASAIADGRGLLPPLGGEIGDPTLAIDSDELAALDVSVSP